MSKKVQRSNMTATDSKGKVIREPKDNASGEAINFRWWDLEGQQMAEAIGATVRFMDRHQNSRVAQLTTFTRLYGSTSIYNTIGTAFSRASTTNSNPASQRISYNVCESVIDTLESKMAKNKVIPTYITNGGIWKVQKKAKQLTKFAQGLFYENDVHKKSIHCWGDAAVWGDGFLHIYAGMDDQVKMERVLPHEIFVDTIETLSSEPTQLHRVKIVSRDIAEQMFPELAEHIQTVSPASYQEVGGQGTVVDLIQIIESWHLRSGPDAKDGVHAITIGEGCLAEDYEKDYFPFAHIRYAKRKLGWYGQGVCERLATIQGEINRSMILKQRSLWMGGSFKILLENGSKVVSQHLNNDVGAIIHYTGTAPQYVAPPATNPELQQWIDQLINYAYQQEGISRMNSTGEVPMGVQSGKAMRTLVQVSDDRFLFMEQEMEAFALEVARQAINVVKDIYADKKTYEVIFPTTKFMETVEWGSINLDEDQYVLKAYPTSSLSDDLTGRLSEIQELTQAGMISPRTAKRLMDMPDVEMNDNLSNAPEDLLHRVFEDMLDDGEYRSPEPFYDLQLAKQLLNEYYNYAVYMNAPNDRLVLLEQFNNQLNDMLGIMNPQPMGVPGAPQAAPMAPPTSNLIPNVPGVQGAA